MKFLYFVTLLLFTSAPALAQYSPELDVRGTDDATDGAEFQLATPSETNFLRFFSGRLGDPSPHLYFSDQDTFRIANGAADFSNFNNRLTIFPNGYVGINTNQPKSQFHFDGDLTTAWGLNFKHYVAGWQNDHQIYLRKSWNGNLWDYLYLGATGNRDNTEQAALILSHRQGILLGKGHNDGNQLSEEHVIIDSVGKVAITDLAGIGERPVMVDQDGVLKAGEEDVGSFFSAILLSDSTLQNATEYTVINWHESYDDSNNFEPISGIYTVPENGLYLFKVRYSWEKDATNFEDIPIITRFKINGNNFVPGQHIERVTIDGSYAEDTNFFLLRRLNNGDKISVSVLAITGGPTILLRGDSGVNTTFISGSKID